jgi:hypothetical protein
MTNQEWVSLAIIIALTLGVGGYFLFRETMNKIQYLERLRLYWITRDNGEGQPRVTWAFMKQDTEPFWYGNGIQFRWGRHTFQVGILKGKAPSLDKQLGKGWLDDIDPRTIRRTRGGYTFAEQIEELVDDRTS